jgi:hypothetical protein
MNEKLYMLRLWEDGESKRWHGSLKNMTTKEVRYFKTLTSLVTYLRDMAETEKRKQEEP